VKRTGHRIDWVCIKCSSLLMKNLKELIRRKVNSSKSQKYSNSSPSYNQDISPISNNMECKSPFTYHPSWDEEATSSIEESARKSQMITSPNIWGGSGFCHEYSSGSQTKSIHNSEVQIKKMCLEPVNTYSRKNSKSKRTIPILDKVDKHQALFGLNASRKNIVKDRKMKAYK